MAQITIYIDDENEKRLKAAAKAAGMSVSRWIANLVDEKTRTEWPETVVSLAGAWPDFPALQSIRDYEAKDVNREPM